MIFYFIKTTKYMSIEEAMMGGIVFKGKKDKPKEENKIKDRKSTRLNSSHIQKSRMPSSA